MNKLITVFFSNASDFLVSLPEFDKAKVISATEIMTIDMGMVHIKPLRPPIKELIVKKYRLLFFLQGNTIYFTNGFTKKTQKTPIHEINYAEKIFKEYEKL